MGCDEEFNNARSHLLNFNPRTHRGVRRFYTFPFYLFHNYFNPRTHRGVRLELIREDMERNLISIHAPIVGCDANTMALVLSLILFQSTHPSWGATKRASRTRRKHRISIHAPIVGCDISCLFLGLLKILFQSTHPSWGATLQKLKIQIDNIFQSTHPSWGATHVYPIFLIQYLSNFNPRTHRGVRRFNSYRLETQREFQSTHPSWGATF